MNTLFKIGGKFGVGAIAMLLTAVNAVVAGIPEPDTVFYGKVINRTSGQEYLLTQGALQWTITQSNGQTVVVNGTLDALKNGEFSYRLNVPHQALSFDAQVSSGHLALPLVQRLCSHVQITVDGQPAKIIAPGTSTFGVGQSLRASTHRLDLELFNPLSDSDGDGIADWWAQRYQITDANGDSDGDGWNNLTEFRNGSNPTNNNRVPTIGTKEVLVYADGTSVVPVQSLDADSAAANLTYTITRLPENGTLSLRNAVANGGPSDRTLVLNDTFTQAAVNDGRLIFTHNGGTAIQSSFEVSLSDGTAGHATAVGTVDLVGVRPTDASGMQIAMTASGTPGSLNNAGTISASEQQLILNYLASKDYGFVIWDASRASQPQSLTPPSGRYTRATYTATYVPSFGADRSHVIVGGIGADQIVGGMNSDVIVSGSGNNLVRGNAGSDVFVIGTGETTTVEDFITSEGDVLDISRALNGSSVNLSNFVQLTISGSNSILRIDSDGNGSGFTDTVVTLSGVTYQSGDLYALVEGGSLLIGNKRLAPRITIAATSPIASENGPTSGAFTLTRTGPTDTALTVNVLLTGSAANGVDYEYVAAQIAFAVGARTTNIVITPYADTITENTEVVQALVQSGSDYVLGNTTSAQVTIEDLAPVIAIEALDETAVKNPQRSGYFLVTRSGILDRSVFVQLTISGRAANGTDYDSVPTFVNFSPFQTAIPIAINPKSSAVLLNGAESVRITVRTNAAYKIGSAGQASMMIVDHEQTFADWKATNFPADSSAPEVFALGDFGARNVRNLQRYAYQLDAQSPQAHDPKLPKFQFRTNELSVVFRRTAGLTDVQFVVEVSSDLTTWHSDASHVEQYFPTEYINDPDMICVRAKNPTTMQFMRVRVLYTP